MFESKRSYLDLSVYKLRPSSKSKTRLTGRVFDLPLLVCSAAARLFAKQATNSKSGYARATLRERPPEGLETLLRAAAQNQLRERLPLIKNPNETSRTED